MSATPAKTFRRFAWDGFTFDTPWEWNLARHETRGALSRISMEDDSSLRLEMEWSRNRRRPDAGQVRQRFDALAAEMRRADAKVTPVAALPPGWVAAVYTMPDGRRRVNALCLAGADFTGVFTLHFNPTGLREPLRTIRQLASSFNLSDGALTEWAVFDFKFYLNADFLLTGTAFDAGSKLMIFEWRWRRFFVWWFSPADVIVRRQPMEEWCSRVLNRFKTLRGPIFQPGAVSGELVWRRDKRYPFGRFEDLYRGCQRYRARCRELHEHNIILLTLFQYRRDTDLNLPRLSLESA